MPIEDFVQHVGKCIGYSRDAIYWLTLGTLITGFVGYTLYHIGGEVIFQVKSFYNKHKKKSD